MLNFEVRCGMTKREFDLRLEASMLRASAANVSVPHSLEAQQGAIAAAERLERQADKIKAETPYVIN